MAVVIDQFEVVPAEPSAAPQNGAAATTAAASPPPLTAHEVARLAELARERALRVWAD
jgi:hypothetical protein